MDDTKTYCVKEYPLEIESTTEGRFYSKGWQPQGAFLEAVNYETSCDDGGIYRAEDIRYEVWRCVPDSEDPRFIYFWQARLGSPGAFPVTVAGG